MSENRAVEYRLRTLFPIFIFNTMWDMPKHNLKLGPSPSDLFQ